MRTTIDKAPACLNTNDKAMWVLGWNELADAVEAGIKHLKALSVTNIMLEVVPGEDGMGQEVYAKSVNEVVIKLTKLGTALEDARGSDPEDGDRYRYFVANLGDYTGKMADALNRLDALLGERSVPTKAQFDAAIDEARRS